MPFRRGIMTGGVFGLAPDSPTSGSASSGANGQSVLTWSAPVYDGGGTISDYLVRYSTDDATWTVFSDGVNASTGATVTGLTNGTLYYFQVAAVNAYGTSGYSSSFSGTPSTVPNAPTAGAATSNANAQSVLTWTAPAVNGGASITDYVVQYSTDNVNFTTFADGVTASTGATVTSLTNGTLYYFRVAAINARGTGAYSASFSATPSTVPSAVQSLSLSAGDRSITATWSAPASNGGSGVTSYTVETQLNSDGWVNQGSQSSGVAFTVRNTTAVTARSYKVRVTANNANGGTSAESGSATPAFGTPATPTGSAIAPTNPNNGTNGSGARALSITFSPLQCAAFDFCEVYIARDGYEFVNYGDYVNLKTTSNAPNQSYSLSVLYQGAFGWYNPPAGTTYYFYTRSRNIDNDYIDSAWGSLTTTATQSYVWTTYGDNSDWGAATAYSDTTGTFTITGNSFSQTSGYAIPGQNAGGSGHIQYSITGLSIEAWVVISGITICTSSRNFLVDFSGTSTSAGTGGGTKDCLVAPFSTNSGTTHRDLAWNITNVPFGNAGAGRIRVRGAGTIGTVATSPDNRIRCIISITGQQRSWVVSSYAINTTYYY